MSERVAVTAAGGTAVKLTSLEWERIQVVMRLRPLRGQLDPARLRLERIAPQPAEPMSPTWSGTDEGPIARFNVMLGPGQQPLAPGRWIVTIASRSKDPGTPLRLVEPDVIEPFVKERVFEHRSGRYRVTPTLDKERGALALDIDWQPSPRSLRALRARPRAWFRRVIKPRQRIFKVLLAYFRARSRRTGRRIVFTSDSHASLSGNLAVVHARMLDRGLDREYELRTIFKPSIAASRGWRDRWRLPRLLARADVILLDDYQPIIYGVDPDPDVRIIQLWHASGAFKTVGYSRIGKPGGPSPFARRHKNYTHAIVNGRHDVPYYAEAFGLPEDRVVPTGIPRMDRFFDQDARAAGRERAVRAFPVIEGRRTILFAPTFRGSGPRSAWYDYEPIDFAGLHAVCEAKNAVVITKMHPFVRERIPIPSRFGDRIVDASGIDIDVNDLLFAVDLLITDYSSIVFEFSTLLRPMLFYAPDLEEYVADRDFYVPFEEFVPGRIVRTFDGVLDAIRTDSYDADKVAAFTARHFDHFGGGATDRIIDELILAR